VIWYTWNSQLAATIPLVSTSIYSKLIDTNVSESAAAHQCPKAVLDIFDTLRYVTSYVFSLKLPMTNIYIIYIYIDKYMCM
jgi:hypothetical protein